ncbi:MAG: NTP transferase domain-containing protein [Flavobacteriales bacterium]|nr:NTP transferase domain-containing protein [Flavobacteriales bacterium]
MTSTGHHKHPPLARPKTGTYHPCEWAICGTTCGAIEEFVQWLHDTLDPDLNMAYVDADHGAPINDSRTQIEDLVIHQDGLDKSNPFDHRARLRSADIVLVNGNHHPASRQVILLDEAKKDSLQRRVDQLDNVRLIIQKRSEQELFDFLQNKISEETLILTEDDSEAIKAFFENEIQLAIPPVKALILAGGKSQRMGQDKSQISYHDGIPHEIHLARMCRNLGMETYLSKASDFHKEEVDGFPVIKDRLLDMGPFGAIISAFMHDPDSAWMALACDLPFVSKAALEHLIDQRNPSKIATTYQSAQKDFPEPLITLYEPKAYPRFMQFLSQGYSCPRKVLINSDTHILELDDDQVIQNVNTPEEMEAVQSELEQGEGVLDREGNTVSFEDIPSMTIEELMPNISDFRVISLLEENEFVPISDDVEQIPYSEFYWNDWVDDGRPAVFYCTTGLRSAEVVYDLMQDHPKAKLAYLKNNLEQVLKAIKVAH